MSKITETTDVLNGRTIHAEPVIVMPPGGVSTPSAKSSTEVIDSATSREVEAKPIVFVGERQPVFLDGRGLLSTPDGRVVGGDQAATLFMAKPTGGNDTAAIESVIAAAELLGSALPVGRYIRVVFAAGAEYLVDYVNPRSNVWLDFNGAVFKKVRNGFDVPSNAMCRTIDTQVNGTWYGRYKNMRLSNGTFDKNNFRCSAHCIRLTNVEDVLLENLTVVHTPGESVGGWAYCIAGRRIRIVDCNSRISTGNSADALLYQDGMHICWGRDIQVIGGYFQAGDDPLVFGTDGDGTATDKWDDEPLTAVTAVGCVVDSSRGAVKAYRGININGGLFRGQVIGARMSGIVGRCGTLRNGGVSIIDTRSTGQNANDLRDIRIEATLDVGSALHDGNNAVAALVSYATDCRIDLAARITDTTGAATRFRGGSVSNSVRCEVNLTCDALPSLGGVLINASTGCGVGGGLLRGGGSNQVVIQATPFAYVRNTAMLEIAAGMAGVFVNGGSSSVQVRGNRFAEAAGASNARAFVSNGAASCAYAEITGNDCSGMTVALNSGFNTSVTAYEVSENRNITTRRGGIAVVGASSTSVSVTHGASVLLADGTEASLPQVSVTPVGSLGSAARYWVAASTGQAFTINTDVAPGGAGARFAWAVDTGRKPV